MKSTIAKRIQSRLSRKGVKVSLGEIKPIYDQFVANDANPTDEEVAAIFEHLMANATKLTVIEEQPQSVPTDHSESDNLETVHNLSTDVDNTLDNPTEEETPGAIAPVATSDLVSQTAESMGITLNIEDVTAIAENFDYASTNSDDELEEIKSAITAFVQHKAQITQQKIDNIVQEVKQTIHNLDAENSQHLNDGLRSISQDIKSGSERFRQQTRQALKVFALPPSKAG